jgi:glycosyltransferase involved in cell wall biosynthesis
MKVLHIIVGLNVGGAEMMLKRLLEHDPDSSQNCAVISLTTLGDIGRALQARGIQVHALNLASFWQVPLGMWRLIQSIRQYKPDVVQTWMYHADLIGGFAACLAGNYPVVWNLRSNLIPRNPFSVPFWLIHLCGISSRVVPTRIICCSTPAKHTHIQMGFAAHKIIVIPNGYDFSSFVKDGAISALARAKLGISDEELLIGVVGRFDPLKDFQTFISAASLVAAKCQTAKFLMIGRGNDWQNIVLRTWIEQAGLVDKFILLGQQVDVAYYLQAMDIFCLSSSNEAFSNVLIEAMAMGLPCVATDVGVANDVLRDASFVVPIKTPAALAKAVLKICHLDAQVRRELGELHAKNVRIKYPIENISEQYAAVYQLITK